MNRRQRRIASRAGEIPTSAQLEALSKEVEGRGCFNCGVRFGVAMPYHVIRLTNGKFAVWCPNCAEANATRPTVATGIYFGVSDPWSSDDCKWFESYHNRRYRLRDPWNGELHSMALDTPDEGAAGDLGREISTLAEQGLRLAITVFQIQPGKRARFLLGVPGTDPLDSFTDAGIERMLPPSKLEAAALAERMATATDPEKFINDKLRNRLGKVTVE